MRLPKFATTALGAAALALGAQIAEAQPFPSHMKSCKKAAPFVREIGVYSVPEVGGGAGIVKVLAHTYDCINSETRNGAYFQLVGMTDANGKELVPFRYAKVLPYSTTGAVVIDHGPGPYPKNLMYRAYTAGRGEGKERFDFQDAVVLQPPETCANAGADLTTRGVSAVVGEYGFQVSGGRKHITLFTPEGKARKLEYIGGDDIKPAVQRSGDFLLARWTDDDGNVRSGILDLDGRQISPVLGPAAIWSSPKGGAPRQTPGCYDVSSDLLVEGPSLDRNESSPFFGPLLSLVDRTGQPVALPKGAVGLFPANARAPATSRSGSRNAAMWAVVFPTQDDFEFTLHRGSPSEALIAAETAPRYNDLNRMQVHGGIIGVRAVSDGKWRVFRPGTDIVVGEPDEDPDRAFGKAEAILDGEASRIHEANAAAWAKEEARRAEAHKQLWETARKTGRLCAYTVSRSNTRAEIEEYLLTCGPGAQSGLAELVREAGISESTVQTAQASEWQRLQQLAKARADWEATLARNARENPGASYMPGQWESAIRGAGDAAVDAINKSSDNWLEQRRAEYNADWQRSQRAY